MVVYGGPDIVTDGLVLHLDAGNPKSYPGSGTSWFDLSGNNSTGTLTNGPTYSSFNQGGISFDGTNDFVLINDPTIIRNQNFTISVWVNPEIQNKSLVSMIDFDHASSPSQGWVLQSEDATTNRYYYLAWHNGTSFQPTGGNGFGVGKGIQITTSTWQNITFIKNGTSLLGYLNSNQVYTGTGTNSNVNYQNFRNLRIGEFFGTPSRSFKGNISNLQIYNRNLTSLEILQNYNALKGRYFL